jgi:hypothetical protein
MPGGDVEGIVDKASAGKPAEGIGAFLGPDGGGAGRGGQWGPAPASEPGRRESPIISLHRTRAG